MGTQWLAGAASVLFRLFPGTARNCVSSGTNGSQTVLEKPEASQSDFWADFTRRVTTPNSDNAQKPAGRNRFLNMLVPIDFTESSLPALECAFSMARKEPAHITLLHAINLNLSVRGPVNFALVKQELRQFAATRLSLIRGCARHENISADFSIVEGKPSAVIENYLKKNQTDLVILTAHKHGRLAGFLHPQTAEKTIRNANCPVLVINS